jgi:hypothetical protein
MSCSIMMTFSRVESLALAHLVDSPTVGMSSQQPIVDNILGNLRKTIATQ